MSQPQLRKLLTRWGKCSDRGSDLQTRRPPEPMRRFALLFIIFLLSTLTACSGHRMKREPSAIRSAVIFIPGYKGSILKKSDSDETVWLDATEILFGGRSLALVGEEVGIA